MTKHIKKIGNLSRRQVLVGSAAGAGLVIGYSILPHAVDSASKAIAAGNWDHQQYLTIGSKNTTLKESMVLKRLMKAVLTILFLPY